MLSESGVMGTLEVISIDGGEGEEFNGNGKVLVIFRRYMMMFIH